MSSVHNRVLSPTELDAFGNELDALRARQLATLGAADARYIRRVVAGVRWTGVAGRALLFLGAFVHSVLIPAWIAGVVLLALSKILENMELAHNVIHGQYDWMGDPQLQGSTYEWDIVGTADNWRKTTTSATTPTPTCAGWTMTSATACCASSPNSAGARFT